MPLGKFFQRHFSLVFGVVEYFLQIIEIISIFKKKIDPEHEQVQDS